MVRKGGTREAIGEGIVTFSVSAGKISLAEKLVLFQLALQQNCNHPDLAKIAEYSMEQVARIMDMTKAKIVLSLERVDLSLERIARLLDYEAVYNKLLTKGAPKAMLRKYFAKTRRQIEEDRRVAGVSAAIIGRPRKINNEKAYEIVGHWERLKEEAPGFVERFLLVHEIYPEISLASLYRLLKNM